MPGTKVSIITQVIILLLENIFNHVHFSIAYQNSLKLGNHFDLISPEGKWDLSAIRRHFKVISLYFINQLWVHFIIIMSQLIHFNLNL